MNVAIEIPDEVARQLETRSGELSQAVLEAVAIDAYRSGTITPAQVQQVLRLASRWETEALLRRTEAYHDYTMDDLERDISAIRDASQR
jgi:predicted HTH domain antitoxin